MTNLKQAIERAMPSINAVAAKHLRPERLLKVAVGAASRNPLLLQCTPATVVRSIVQSAELGLEAGSALGEAYLVPFRNGKTNTWECQLIPGYRGLIALARRSGQIAQLEARVVYEHDTFDVAYGLEPVLIHKPKLDGERGKLSFVYAVAHFVGGGTQWEVMTRGEIEAIRMRSMAGRNNNGPWGTDYEEMSRKTVVKRLVKYLPLSVEMAQAVQIDNAADAGEPTYFDEEILEVTDSYVPDSDATTVPTGMAETVAKATETVRKKAPKQKEKPAPVEDAEPQTPDEIPAAPIAEGDTHLPEPKNGITVGNLVMWEIFCKRFNFDKEDGFDGLPKEEREKLRTLDGESLAKRGLVRN